MQLWHRLEFVDAEKWRGNRLSNNTVFRAASLFKLCPHDSAGRSDAPAQLPLQASGWPEGGSSL